MIEIGSGSVSMRKLQSTTFGLRPKACGGLKKLESVFVAESTKAIEAWLDGNPNQTVYAVALHELYRELEGQIVLPQLAINSLQVRMALSTAICENFHRNRSSAVAVASSVNFGCLEGTASSEATRCSILILWFQLVCQNFATFFHPLAQRQGK